MTTRAKQNMDYYDYDYSRVSGHVPLKQPGRNGARQEEHCGIFSSWRHSVTATAIISVRRLHLLIL